MVDFLRESKLFYALALVAISFTQKSYGLRQACRWAAVVYFIVYLSGDPLEYGYYITGNLYYLALDAFLILLLIHLHAPRGAWAACFIAVVVGLFCIAFPYGWSHQNYEWLIIPLDLMFMYYLTVWPKQTDPRWNDHLPV